MNGSGVLLETARRAQGLTQDQLASVAGTTQAAISRYERGLREADGEALSRLADALGLTPAFLTQSGRVRGAVAVDAHMRRRASAKPSDWRRIEARLNMHRLHARRFFEEVALHAEQRVPTFDPFDTEASAAARFVRMQWRLPSGPVRDLTGWVEAAGCLVLEEDFGTPRIDGVSQWIDALPVVLLNSEAPTDRKRLTLAHELGHLCLHSQEIGDDVEAEATAFASEFLMPMEIIRPQLRNLTLGRLHDLKREWGVSMQAIIERASQAGLLEPKQRTYLYKRMSAFGWRTTEPVSDELPAESPSLPAEISHDLTAQGLLPSEIATLLGLKGPDIPHPFLPRRQTLRAL